MVPTRAAVLVFGRARHVRRILPRPVVDCQFIDYTADSWTTDRRWNDRLVVEENLVQAWLMLSERYAQYAEHPFGVDAARLRRNDDPPATLPSVRRPSARETKCSPAAVRRARTYRVSLTLERDTELVSYFAIHPEMLLTPYVYKHILCNELGGRDRR